MLYFIKRQLRHPVNPRISIFLSTTEKIFVTKNQSTKSSEMKDFYFLVHPNCSRSDCQEFDVILGCEGASSHVRAKANIGFPAQSEFNVLQLFTMKASEIHQVMRVSTGYIIWQSTMLVNFKTQNGECPHLKNLESEFVHPGQQRDFNHVILYQISGILCGWNYFRL